MPPDDRPLPRFIAEPPQEALPYGRWADALAERFLEAVRGIEADEGLGEAGAVNWVPGRSDRPPRTSARSSRTASRSCRSTTTRATTWRLCCGAPMDGK